MKISIVNEITDRVVEAVHNLLPQLSPSAVLPGKDYLREMIISGASVLFIAEDEGKIVGMLTFAVYLTPSGRKAWIEDVVTDSNLRGKGIGRLLVEASLDYAKKRGIKKVDLTSSAARKAAHALYEKMGFQKRDTTVFRIEL